MKLTKLTTPTCGQCRLLTPMLDGMEAEGTIEVEEINLLERPDIQEQYGIKSVPTVIFHSEEGEVVRTGIREIMGFVSTRLM